MDEDTGTVRDWGWVFHVLTKGPSTNRCKIPLPDTILFKDSEPCRWVFTAKSGHVMSRSGNKLKLAKMKRRLLAKVGDDEEEDRIPVCLHRKGDTRHPQVKYLSPKELVKFCAEDGAGGVRGGTIAIQDFIDAAHPIAFRCVYSRVQGDEIGIHAKKGFRFETYKINHVSERAKRIFKNSGGGVGGGDICKSQMTEANALIEGITFRICRFIEASLPLRVARMSAEFVMDDYGQAWFTHTSELITVPKEKKWQPDSGNTNLFVKSPDMDRKLRKPHRVRVQPGRDGITMCAGDYCHDIKKAIEIEGGEDMTQYTAEDEVAQEAKARGEGKKAKKAGEIPGPAVATHAVLYKSIYLARRERAEEEGLRVEHAPVVTVYDRLQAQIGFKTRMTAEGELAQRQMPQLIPTYASKHSLTDYYDMVPVCQHCSKVYLRMDRLRNGEEDEVEEEIHEPPKSPLLGNMHGSTSPYGDTGMGGTTGTALASVEEEVDNTAAGIRERLMEMYSLAAKAPPKEDKTIVLNTKPLLVGSSEVSNLLKISRIKKQGNTDEDYEEMFSLDRGKKKRSKSSMNHLGRLPNVKKLEETSFPRARSKTSMDGSIAKASRGIGANSKLRTLPTL